MAARAQVIVDQFAIDTDLFVHAHRSDVPEHARARKGLSGPGLGDRRSS
jgi:predicted nucleic acid-binding protein